jgi:hypothetical protein
MNFSPAPEELRGPTIAIISRVSTSGAPRARTLSKGGAASSVPSRGGQAAAPAPLVHRQDLMSGLKVRGPTLLERISRSRSISRIAHAALLLGLQ